MDIKSLKHKDTLIDDNGDEYVDLSQPSIKAGSDIAIIGGFRVTPAEEMRPDLICLKYYGSTEYLDILLKVNNIFNPFSIKEGDFLLIPDVNNAEQHYDNAIAGNKKRKVLAKQFTDTSRMSKKDAARIERLKQKAKGKNGAVTEPLPPNMLQPGVKGKIISPEQILLGANLKTRDE